jgi:hypothetical protein
MMLVTLELRKTDSDILSMQECCRDIDLGSYGAHVCSLNLFQDWYMRTAVSLMLLLQL